MNSLDKYMNAIWDIPILTKEEEAICGYKALKGDKASQDKLVKHNLRFVVFVAKKYLGHQVVLDDLIGAGNIGLITASQKYDPDIGRFTTMAGWWIKDAITMSISKNHRTIRIPKHIEQKINKCIKEAKKHSEDDCAQKIANALEVDVDTVRHLLEIDRETTILESVEESEKEIALVLDPQKADIDKLTQQAQSKAISKALDTLPFIEKDILSRYYGLYDQTPCSMREAGRANNKSGQGATDIKNRGMDKLKLLLVA